MELINVELSNLKNIFSEEKFNLDTLFCNNICTLLIRPFSTCLVLKQESNETATELQRKQ